MKRVKDVERLKREGNATCKAGRLNEGATEALDVSMGYRIFDNISEYTLSSACRRRYRRRTDARDVI